MSHILLVILLFSFLALLFGLLLGYAAIRFRVEADPVVEKLDALLPQTQCGQCGYPGCRPYAEAIAAVVVGGTSLKGGEGRIFGTLVGAILLSVISNILNLTSIISVYLNAAVQGIVIIMVAFMQHRR